MNINIGANELIIAAISIIVPYLIGLVLTRKKTIGYGMVIYNIIGGLTLQKNPRFKQYSGIFQALLGAFVSTLADISFGIYIASRRDITKEQRQKKIEIYLNGETAPEQVDIKQP